MEFHFYYIIQDIVGVMLAFLGIRMFLLCLKMISINKLSKGSIFLLIRYTLMVLAGVNLLLNKFGLRPWVISILLMILALAPFSKKE
ncbi:hypothetical protein NSA24_08365 [Clostridioides mangenotii]|uniref:hypothetical protein n=1 Tax=Metaclostridioides mangenotii TaxID=1540 RepID=UPI001C128C2D|nr:hypothetical protein [Clostridioides mangenotii]MBU5307206.1 hypothetical protein [Clostridioides mangenotii]MCR1954808.1 hypothetical protein [Clostridioides mangenotii]